MIRFAIASILFTALIIPLAMPVVAGSSSPPERDHPAGRVHLKGHCFVDDNGPFLGLGVSYFTALRRCKYDRQRLESDLEFLSQNGFNYFRMLSMVGWYSAWDGLEIAPVDFTNEDGKHVEAWPDYWRQFGDLIDLAYDRYGLRTQITIFADAQLMPEKSDRVAHMNGILTKILPGREHKILFLEVANEAWQNGFPGEQGIADLREFAKFLDDHTKIPVAITSNHPFAFGKTYAGSAADLATWHFSRDRGPHNAWLPVYDCWDLGNLQSGLPVVSNEPIGPGSSVDDETSEIRLVMAAAFAYTAGLPAYVFHSEAGVFGKSRFEEMAGIKRYKHLLKLLPADLPNWNRNDGKGPQAPFTAFADGRANKYWSDLDNSSDGCLRNIGARQDDRFVCVPIGIRPGGLTLEARDDMRFQVYNPLTGEELLSATKHQGQRIRLPQGPGGLVILGVIVSDEPSSEK